MNIKAKKKEYDAKSFFESWHLSSTEFSDRMTISPTFSRLGAKYHYNIVENSIIEFFYDLDLSEDLSVLDIGAGAGHWIDFYRETFNATYCMGIDISEPLVLKLSEKYLDQENVEILVNDISTDDFNLSRKFQIINAVGVLFHIVNDSKWLTALENLKGCLEDNGLIIVGGQFGLTTDDVQFCKVDKFKSWKERKDAWDKFSNTDTEEVLVNKRVRSLMDWQQASNQCGLEIIDVIRANKRKEIKTPENNILVLKKALSNKL